MPEPSLAEINSFRPDPELGTGTPAVVIDHANIVRTLNENARAKQANDMNRYNTFMERLSDVYKSELDIAKTDMRAQDRDKVTSQLADRFKKISEDPKAFFSRQGMDDTYKDLATIQSDATKSKQANLYDNTHAEFVQLNPTFQTEANKKKIEQAKNIPLASWQPYQLDYTPHLDITSLTQAATTGSTKETGTYITPDGKMVVSGEKKASFKDFSNYFNSENLDPEKKKAIKNQFIDPYYNQLPDDQKVQFQTKDGKVDDDKVWKAIAFHAFRGEPDPKDPNNKLDFVVSAGKGIINPLYRDETKAATAEKVLKDKQQFQVGFENLRQGNRMSLAKLRGTIQDGLQNNRFKNSDEKDRYLSDYLTTYMDNVVEGSYKKGDYLTKDGNLIGLKLIVDNPTKVLFSRTEENIKGKESKVPADDIILNPDGQTYSAIFYKYGTDIPDDSKTVTFTKDELPARIGENLFGKTGAYKALSQMGDYQMPAHLDMKKAAKKQGIFIKKVIDAVKGTKTEDNKQVDLRKKYDY